MPLFCDKYFVFWTYFLFLCTLVCIVIFGEFLLLRQGFGGHVR